MVVAAGRDERRLAAEPAGQLEAEHALVERERAVEVGDLEVDVADVGARVERGGSYWDFGWMWCVVAMIDSVMIDWEWAARSRRLGRSAVRCPAVRRGESLRERARAPRARDGRPVAAPGRPRRPGPRRAPSPGPLPSSLRRSRGGPWGRRRGLRGLRSASRSTSRVTPLLLSRSAALTSTMRIRCSGACASSTSRSASSGSSPVSPSRYAPSDPRTAPCTRLSSAHSSPRRAPDPAPASLPRCRLLHDLSLPMFQMK